MKLFKYKIYSLILISILFIGVFIFTNNYKVYAQADALLKFEGKVTNTDGTELADGNYDFTFNLYDSATGGTSLWSENLNASTRFSGTISGVGSSTDGIVYTYGGGLATSTLRLGQYLSKSSSTEKALIVDYDTALNTITVASSSSAWVVGDDINNRPYVEGGVIDINLGSVSDLSGVDFSNDLFLEIVFNGETMQPRKVITTEARAFDASRLGGKSASDFASLLENETVSGEWSFNNALSVATNSTETALTISQNGSGNIVEFKTGASTSLAVLADGRVKIGDYYFPTEQAGVGGYVLKTDAFGNLSWQVDIAGSGGGSGLWASTTDNIVYGADPAQILVIGNNATTTLDGQQFEVNGSSLFDKVNITNQEELRFYDADSSNYTAIKATGTIASNFVLSLPGSLGSAGQALLTDANGNLSWGTPTGFTYVHAGVEGQLPYYAADGSVLSATSSLFLTPGGYFGIGTTSPYKNLAVEGGGAFDELCLGGDCISNWSSASTLGGSGVAGQVAVWTNANNLEASSTLSVTVGGTGKSSWTPYSIPYISGTTTMGEIPVGSANYLLAVNATADGYTWIDTGSVGVDTNDQVKVSAGSSAAGYLGSLSSDGVFRTDSTLSYADGGDYITIGVANDAIGNTQLEYDTGQALTSSSNPTFNNLTLSGLSLTGWNDGLLTIVSGSVGTTTNNIANWNAAYASSTVYDAIYASSTNYDSTYNIVEAGHDNWNAAYASTTVYDGMYASSTYWDIAYNWGNHADQNYFSTSSSVVLEIIHGGTGANNVSDARNNLGLTIGADVQAYDMGLQTIAGLATTSNLFMVANGTSWATQDELNVRSILGLSNIYDYAIDSADTYGKLWITRGSGIRGQWMSTSSLAINFTDLIGTLAVDQGGTGKASWDNQGILYATGTEISQIATGSADQLFAMNATGDGYLWVSAGSVGVDTNDRVGVDSSATAGYLGSSSGGGVFRTDSTLSYIDGGDYITIGVANDSIGNTQLEYDTGQNLAPTSSPTFAGMHLSGFDNSILIIDGGAVSTTTNNTANWDTAFSWGDYRDEHYFATSSGGILEILYGGTGAANAAGARENLDLDQIHKFAINATGTVGWIWQSDGDGRGNWVATGTLGIASGDVQAKLVGTTTDTFDGHFSTSTLEGYTAANELCAEEYPGSFFCRTYDILVTIEQDDISSWGGSAWIAEGPPGYTSNSNDCKGWTDNNSTVLGAFWAFDSSGGGMGWLTNCSGEKPIACCAR